MALMSWRTWLGGGNSNIFLLSPPSLGKWSNLTSIFFKRCWNHQLEKSDSRSLKMWSVIYDQDRIRTQFCWRGIFKPLRLLLSVTAQTSIIENRQVCWIVACSQNLSRQLQSKICPKIFQKAVPFNQSCQIHLGFALDLAKRFGFHFRFFNWNNN